MRRKRTQPKVTTRSARASARPATPAARTETDQVTYRELRNTPGRVWERLAANEYLTLVADGEPKAIVIPVRGGDPRDAVEAYRRGRAMMAIARIRRRARDRGAERMTLAEINATIREAREERRRLDG